MNKPRISSKVVHLEYDEEYDYSSLDTINKKAVWRAGISNSRISTGEIITIRAFTGATRDEAYDKLKAFIEEQGWELVPWAS